MTNPSGAPAPLVAVVTPVYNGEEFLAETMESVQAQTYPNVVHVLLNNASTDRTPEIIESFQGRRVPLLVGRNERLLPMDDNWNAALALIPAEAAYFTVVCADDVLTPDAVAKMIALAESDPSILVVSSPVLRNGVEVDFKWPQDRNVFESDEATRAVFTNAGTIDARLALFRRSALEGAAEFFDPTIGFASDIDAVLRTLARGKLGFVHEPLMHVREHVGTASHGVHELHLNYFDWLRVLGRHGPRAFGASYGPFERLYRRFYLRRMIKWRWRERNLAAFKKHLELLAGVGLRPTPWDFADAAVYFGLTKAGLAADWAGYPD